MSSDVFDKLLASRPVNRQSARVLGGGFSYEPEKIIAQAHWTAPPRTKPMPSNAENLIGRSFGRFTVIGYLGSKNGGGSLWLVRCACGDYESRLSRSVKNPNNDGDRCEKCRQLSFLKRRDAWLRNPSAPQKDSE